ncbi:MAG: YHS domain-containing (seleno)protein [Pseudomonadota bacterium]
MKTILKFAAAALLISIAVLYQPSAAVAAEPVYTGFFSNVAVSGYDTVAYFQEKDPVKGSKRFQTEWNGAIWRFSSQENLDLFTANPETFAPQFGGYCAWAISQGYTASGDPKQWSIHNDKLYLNYDADVKAEWLTDKDGFIAKGESNWPSVLE